MAVVEKGGKPAHTQWLTLSSYREKFALIECRISTGRTHQIRVHLSSLNHPIAGDSVYGYKASKNHGYEFPPGYAACPRFEFYPSSIRREAFILRPDSQGLRVGSFLAYRSLSKVISSPF